MNSIYYLWGAGGVGKRAVHFLSKRISIQGIIDNDPIKQGKDICEIPICSYEKAKPFLDQKLVIITHFSPKSTEETLAKDGFKSIRLHDFISHFFWEEKKENAIGFLDFPITSRCSLNCKDCMQRIPEREKEDITIEDLKKSLDLLFFEISFVGEISVIGGEPLLYDKLDELLAYMVKHYKSNIGSIVITTNGTILPKKEVLRICKEEEVFISISDYSNTLPKLKNQLENFENIVRKSGVKCERKHWHWSKPGNFDQEYGYHDCFLVHMQLYKGKIWKCTLMAAAYYAGLCEAKEKKDYYKLGSEINELHTFLLGDHLTTQCHKCLYPLDVGVESAVQE